MTRQRTVLVVGFVFATAALVAAGALAAQRWVYTFIRDGDAAPEGRRRFELAKASSRPTSMLGKELTPADKAVLQAGTCR
jgi:hypothetical protein